ncbi:MAG: hypothetical protein ACJ790_16815 [Myxococcaceae bacterium]
MLAFALIPLLCAAEPSLRHTEISAGLSGVGAGYTVRGGMNGDFTLGPDVRAQLLFSGVTVDSAFLLSVPTDALGVATSSTLTLRLGYTAERFQILLGAVAQYAQEAQPALQLLPSVRAEAEFTKRLRFSASLFGHHGLAPVELAWEQESFSVGYLPPLGGSFQLRVPVGGEVALSVGALAFRLYNTDVAMVSVAGVLGVQR